MSYHELERTFYRLSQLDHASGMLQWDRYVMMPPGGNAARSRALAELDVMRTEILQDPALDERFASALEANDLSDWQQANLRQMTLDWKRARALPKDLVEAQSLASTECEHAWRTLRPENNWRDFQPLLQKVFDLAREAAQAQREALSEERGFANDYDALLDQFDPGTLMHCIDPVFDRLKSTLPNLTRDILERQATRPTPMTPAKPVPVDKQDALARELMAVLGFNFDAGRLDPTAHPFSGGAPEDSRVTTRYDEHNVIEGLMGVIHETGHARYESGLPRDWLHQPVGRSMGMGVHESQSLFFEMQLGRSRPFINAIAPLVRKHLGEDPAFEADNLHALYTRVEPGKIRVNADEVTYPMHVILRYELERDIILGRSEVADIPERWDEAMSRYLGLDTKGDFRDGPMQDIHWPMGAVGYFPSYTLGALNAAQLHAALVRAVPDAGDCIARLELQPIFDWLAENIWQKGCYLEYDDLMKQATGDTLNPDYFLNHVRERYLGE
ncbi:carboxypeptidase M32 [Saccharospirillum salsuginis]|uniref:Metal-dependent carboxypeptidase n=1 Tax=Saccharospirillum salsuginis TaxID=418750 RepID=A0A918KBR3_9GAMM|nr:carboxypeptidase M32 [Saccharospirillum salsuginis]GGX56742.1 carboxypeptidase Taq [Saccharospirillum salsuginis]